MPKVFITGIDGATLNLIIPLVKEGRLPNFGRLINEGACGRLRSVPNQRSAAAWTSLMTGKNPGKHGIYEFYEYVPGTYDIRFLNAGNRNSESLWGLLSRHGKKVIVINVPMTYPAEEVNGILISGLDAPGSKSKGFMYPPGLSRELTEKFGDYLLEPGITGLIVEGRIDEAIEMLHKELDQKYDITNYLMDTYPWDFFMVVFRSLDAVQHCFWKYMDPLHPGYTPEGNKLYGNVICDVYKKLDSFIGKLLAKFDEKVVFMIVSDHGFGRKHCATAQLNQWLESKGYLHMNRRSGSLLPKRYQSLQAKYLAGIYKAIVGKTSRRFKEKLVKLFPEIRNKVQSRLIFAGIDWSRTRAYSDHLFPNIMINLKGREPLGTVEEDEHREIIKKIKTELLECRDNKTGERIVEAVFEKDEIYSGPYTEYAPDLLVRWREDIIINGIEIENSHHKCSTLSISHPPIPGEDSRIISGDHQLDGIIFVKGPAIKQNHELKNAEIIDIAPNVHYQLNCPIPDDVDGKIFTKAYERSYLTKNLIIEEVIGSELRNGTRSGSIYSKEDSEAIAERLRNLGYLE